MVPPPPELYLCHDTCKRPILSSIFCAHGVFGILFLISGSSTEVHKAHAPAEDPSSAQFSACLRGAGILDNSDMHGSACVSLARLLKYLCHRCALRAEQYA
jgi:hypothetical protein